MLIYKVLRKGEWAAFDATGVTDGAAVDREDGFIHLSTADQLPGTLERHFAGETGLRLLAIPAEAVAGDLRWEPARGGALFPHLYRPLSRADVSWSAPIGWQDGRHVLPDGVT